MNIKREILEEQQIWIYIFALIAGALSGVFLQNAGLLGILIEPAIAILLYSMFCQIPFLHLRKAFRNISFFKALLFGNFILIPILVWMFSLLLPDNSVILLGVFLTYSLR